MQFVHGYKPQEYAEDYQTRPCKFAFAKVSGDIVNVLHSPVLCRSFLDDTLVWVAKEQAKERIYGYNFAGPIDKKQVTLYITDKEKNSLVSNVAYLNSIEKDLGITPTKVTTVDSIEHLVVGDKWWMLTTVHFSWYTWLLRQLTYNKKITEFEDIPESGVFENGDQEDFKDFHKVLAKLDVTLVRGSKEGYSGSTMHNYNGFYNQKHRPGYTTYGHQIVELMNELQPS